MLSPREYQILRVIVNEYMSSAQPVGSRLLWTRYGLGVSPATIRNVMAALTSAGFLSQPHTSAGRVPTEQAYRLLFDDDRIPEPSEVEQVMLNDTLKASEAAPVQLRNLVRRIADATGTSGVQSDEFDTHYYYLGHLFGQPEFQNRLAGDLAKVMDSAGRWLPQVAKEPGRLVLKIVEGGDAFGVRGLVVVTAQVTQEDYTGYGALLGSTRLPYRKVVSLFNYGIRAMEKSNA